ncbi:FadR/GntR family transcriptional regulator [Tropicimonas sp.]|uniref:FadR/GntR family transcriptional regulator n=1 Tax=Tropicimonas sp. TaxID=2067044 RepID=UPI003A87E204
MTFFPVESEKLSRSVAAQIELLILRGVLRPGERLPAERDLAERMGVSRPSLRAALSELEEAGLVQVRAGSGIYIADLLAPAFPVPLIRLFATHDEAVHDYIAFRRDMEGLTAARAAEAGSATDIAVIAGIFGRMEQAHESRAPGEEARLDAEFHMAIVEAAHNLVMLHMMRGMYRLLREGIFANRAALFQRRSTRATLLAQHRAIFEAIRDHDPDRARNAVGAHLDFVEQTMIDLRRTEHNERIARQRLLHAAES